MYCMIKKDEFPTTDGIQQKFGVMLKCVTINNSKLSLSLQKNIFRSVHVTLTLSKYVKLPSRSASLNLDEDLASKMHLRHVISNNVAF